MRVTVVTTWLPTDRAPSSGSFVLRDSAAIRDAGQDVRIIHLVPPHQDDGARHRTLEGMRVLSIPMKPSNPLSVARPPTGCVPRSRAPTSCTPWR